MYYLSALQRYRTCGLRNSNRRRENASTFLEMGSLMCLIEECPGVHFGLGYCVRHYQKLYRYGDPLWEKPVVSAAQRFWKYVDPCRTDNCYVWTGGKMSKGYGAFLLEGKPILAHHFLTGKPVPPLEYDHLCRNILCVAPHHLEAVTHAVNIERARPYYPNTLKTQCVRGHLFDEENTRFYRNGRARACRACDSLRGSGTNRKLLSALSA